jgi:lipopolysaccharide transport system ATP-binding protein
MQVRLAFAVAAHIEPEVLIIDEVLAVGDAAFQRKCLGKIGEVASGGRTVLFVSHQMAAVESLCTRALLMADGRVARDGAVPDTIEAYLASSALLEGQLDLSGIEDRSGLGELRFAQVSIWGERADQPPRTGGPLHVRMRFDGELRKARTSRVGIAVSSLGTRLFTCSTELTLAEPPMLEAEDVMECVLPELPLGGGRYTLTFFLEQAGVVQDWLPDACQFEVLDADFFGHGRNAPLGHEGRTVLVEHAWTTGATGEGQ